MLNMQFNEVVLIGSTSDIGVSIINKIPLRDGATLHLIGRRIPDREIFKNPKLNLKFHKCNLGDIEEIADFLKDLTVFKKAELVILATGFLPEENSEFNLFSLRETFEVNSISAVMCLSSFSKVMSENNGGKILVCSSVASIRPRLRNFTYGASKSALDFYAVGLQNKLKNSKVRILILRPGYVFTKMTKKFKPAPFAIGLDSVAEISSKGIMENKKIIYAPTKLKIIMNLTRILPRFIYDRIG